MISVQNRLPEPGKENRVSITPDNGSAVEGVLAYADDATQEGTFWNRKTAQLLQGDIRTYPVREGQSISAGDVVNVGGSPETVYKDVTPQDNVENVISSASNSGTAVIKISDEYSIGAFITTNNANRLFVIDNADGTRKSQTDYFYRESITSVSLSKINNNKFIVLYISSATLYGIVCTVNGTTITIGSQYTIASSVSNNVEVIALSDSLALSIYNSSGLKCKALPISGTTITTSGTVYSLSDNTGARYISACKLPDDSSGNKRVCICFSGTGDGNKGKAVIATIDSSNAVTFGDVVTLTSSAIIITSCASDGNAILISTSGNTSGNLFLLDMNLSTLDTADGKIGVIENIKANTYVFHGTNGNAIPVLTSGNSIRTGESYPVNGGGSTSYPSLAAISKNQVLLAYADNGNSMYGTTTILEVSGNQIAGSFIDNSSDAIALVDGTGGQEIPVGFGGYCECPGVTEGQTIDSSGVSAFSPMDGWLSIRDARDKGYVVGEYTGTDQTGQNNPTIIDIGFSPVAVAIFMPNSTYYCLMFNGWNRSITNNEDGGYGVNIVQFTTNGISFYYSSGPNPAITQMNQNGQLYKYIAWR